MHISFWSPEWPMRPKLPGYTLCTAIQFRVNIRPQEHGLGLKKLPA
jgi:hypothetical protein